MKISSRFTIAVHMLTCVEYFHDTHITTSEFLAGSIGVNPVVVRQIFSQLKAAGLVDVARGKGGVDLLRPLDDITLYDVYEAVDSVNGSLFRFHENPNPECPVGKNIHNMLDGSLNDIQDALESKMKSITLGEIYSVTKKPEPY